jgi:hypothetical protein
MVASRPPPAPFEMVTMAHSMKVVAERARNARAVLKLEKKKLRRLARSTTRPQAPAR